MTLQLHNMKREWITIWTAPGATQIVRAVIITGLQRPSQQIGLVDRKALSGMMDPAPFILSHEDRLGRIHHAPAIAVRILCGETAVQLPVIIRLEPLVAALAITVPTGSGRQCAIGLSASLPDQPDPASQSGRVRRVAAKPSARRPIVCAGTQSSAPQVTRLHRPGA
ncbi:MAG: hypothetical protein AAF501_21275 [Pseudomonadota bacterium]